MQFPLWLKRVLAIFIGGAANTVTVVVVDPVAFNFGSEWKKTLTVALVGGILAVANYLKATPVPPIDQAKGGNQ